MPQPTVRAVPRLAATGLALTLLGGLAATAPVDPARAAQRGPALGHIEGPDSGSTASILLTADDVRSLDEYEALGVFFSPSMSIFSFFPACSVLDDPECGPVSVPNGICAGPCGGEVGVITSAAPVTAVSVYALSGPGRDRLSFGTEVRAYDADGGLLDVDEVDPDLQFQLLTVIGPGIVRIEVDSPFSDADAWDDIRIYPDALPCDGDLDYDGIVGEADLSLAIENFGTAGLGAQLAEPLDVLDVRDLIVLLGNWGRCDAAGIGDGSDAGGAFPGYGWLVNLRSERGPGPGVESGPRR